VFWGEKQGKSVGQLAVGQLDKKFRRKSEQAIMRYSMVIENPESANMIIFVKRKHLCQNFMNISV
jgi:hypothetical protein